MQASIYESLSKEHPDVTYYKREDISLILSKGLAQTCREKPRNPIEYFATWLQEYSQVQKAAKEQTDEAKTVGDLREGITSIFRPLQQRTLRNRRSQMPSKQLMIFSGSS